MLNEYKGNVFEFLVANSLARQYEILPEFLNSIEDSFYSILEQQQLFIHQYFPDVYNRLPVWAEALATQFTKHRPELKIKAVRLIGKIATSSYDQFGTADIILVDTADEEINLSIKLAKANTYVNSKSSGVHSFITKYISKELTELQYEFDLYFKKNFDELALSLNELAGLELATSFSNWEQAGLPVLPGELENEYSERYKVFTKKINTKLFDTIDRCYENGYLLPHVLRELCGVEDGFYQLIFFHHSNGAKEDAVVLSLEDFNYGQNIEVIKQSYGVDLKTNKFVLQLRLKPMNKFTTSYKINCAYKLSSLIN